MGTALGVIGLDCLLAGTVAVVASATGTVTAVLLGDLVVATALASQGG